MFYRTILLLICSNVFMTLAWYHHLRNENWPLWKAILLSWLIAFFEYCLAVPANRFGQKAGMNLFQLKIAQEAITLVVFTIYAVAFANNAFHWKYLVSFLLLIGAVYFVFADIK
ncbi:DMT family protein [Niabella aurantiaca]|uniref:DMT family protein n=1 Tax=Niabella aurantiaca TaxID=379900 RepID=UPI000362184D|nr:DMT family protein [Niabella aurantiaca]